MIVKELRLASRRVDSLSNYYPAKLGFELVGSDESMRAIQIGYTKVEFKRLKESDPSYFFSINLPSNHIEDAKRWIAARVKLTRLGEDDETFFPYWKGARAFYFEDPVGNVVQCLSRLEARSWEQPAFNSGGLFGIGMVGLAVEDVPKAADRIISELGEQPRMDLPLFTVIGNHEGGFIIVEKGKKWHPLNKVAEIHPLEITLLGEQEKEFEIEGHPYKIKVAAES